LENLISKKQSLEIIVKEIDKTRIQEKKRMTANHTYNSKTQRGRLTQLSKTYFSKNRSAFMNTTVKDLQKQIKGSIFNVTKEKTRNSSKLDLSDLKRINSFRTSNISSEINKGKIKNELKTEKSENEDDMIIVLNKEKKQIKEIVSHLVIYSEDSENEDEIEEIEKIPIIKANTQLEGKEYSINLTGVENEVRRRVKTNYTKNEIDKLFEHKKNNILIHKAHRKNTENEAEDGEFLRVFTGKRNTRNKSHRSLNRSNTMMSDRSRSIYKQNTNEKSTEPFRFEPTKTISKNNLKLSDVNRDKKKSLGTSIDKSQMNTSIIKEHSRDSTRYQNDLVRDKSMSDPIREYKIKYKSDNVLGQIGRFEDDVDNLNQTISLNDFQIVRELGSGKFGKVVKVKRKINGDEFAVKLIPIKNTLDKNDEANLNSESEIFKTISDKYVVKAYYW
jgi:hypothetical protein